MKWILLLAVTSSIFALDVPKLRKQGYSIYQIKSGESFETVVSKLYKETEQNHISLTEFRKKLREWNPHLSEKKDFAGEYIYSKYPYSPNLNHQWAPSLTFSGSKRENYFKEPSDIVNFIHITFSQGTFSEDINGNSIESQQNSPFTIGAGIGYKFKKSPRNSISSSIYYSNLKASNIKDPTGTVTNKNLDLDAEIGANFYYQRGLRGWFNNLYTGLDYERFNTFNFDQVIDGLTTELKATEQRMTFLTGGFGLFFDYKKPIRVKVSYSQGITSATELEGSKYLFYINQSISKRYWYHLLFKQHNLEEGQKTLSITRYGIGFGMAF
jgi:hypothetical protein